MVVLGVIDADMLEWWRAKIFIDWHEVLRMAVCVYDVCLVDFISNLEEDAENLMRRICPGYIDLPGCRDRYLYRNRFSLVVNEGVFLETANDGREVSRRFAYIAAVALMNFESLKLDRGGG